MNWVAIGSAGCAAAVAMGAFGAHGLRARLDADALVLWETAARYLMYGSLGLLAMGIYGRVSEAGGQGWSTALLALGVLIFTGTVAALALGGPRWLGAVTPIGGVLIIAGFLTFAWSVLRS